MRNLSKQLFLFSLILFITSCVQDNQITLTNLNSGDSFIIGSSKVIKGKSPSNLITSVDYYINNHFVNKQNVTNANFRFNLNFDIIGTYSLKLVAKDSSDNEMSQLVVNYRVIEEIIAPSPEPSPAPTPLPGSRWSDFNYSAPTNAELSNKKNLWATYYFLPLVNQLKSGGFALRNMQGQSLGIKVARKDWCDAAMEGSVIVNLLGGGIKTLNYAGTSSNKSVNCKKYYSINTSRTKFQLAKGKYGDGVKGYNLVPFRSIAVDKRYIPYGTLMFIPSAVGTVVTLPNGEKRVHDGYFFSADTGGAIKKTHIDVYIGTSKRNPFNFVKSSSSKKFIAYIVNSNSIKMDIENFHKNLR